MSIRNITLFGNKTLGPYKLSDIFNPDVDGTDPAAAGKIVPAVYSQVIDDIHGKKNKLYTVIAVDESTFKSTLIPSAFIATTDDEERIVSYGNDIYMLYYIEASGRLIVDNKLTFFGDQGVKYQLLKINADGSTTVVSKYTSDPVGGGVPVVDTIDLVASEVSYVKKCPNCYTDVTLAQGQQIYLNILDSTDIVVAAVALIVKEASGILEAVNNPIINLTVTANQMDGDDIILYVNQNKDDLEFEVRVVYADATEEVVTIDSITTYLYGFSEINSNISNATYTLLFKKYLPSSDYKVNYVACTKLVKIITPEIPYGLAKISPIPIWNETTKVWDLKLLAYYADRITNPEYMVGVSVGTYSGSVFDTSQNITINTTHENPSGIDESYTQSFSIKLNNPNKVIFDSIEYTFTSGTGTSRVWTNSSNPSSIKTISFSANRWIQKTNNTSVFQSSTTTASSNPWNAGLSWQEISTGTVTAKTCTIDTFVLQNPASVNWLLGPIPNTSNIFYGNNSVNFKRPRIYYGTRPGSTGSVYHIPSSIFGTSSTSMLNVINNFYTNANPPRRSTEAFAPTPTHFVIKDSSTLAALTSTPIAIANWNSDLAMIAGYTGKTVIVEFLVEDDGDYLVIYGVPVEVVSASI